MRGFGEQVEWARVAEAVGGRVVSSRVAGTDVDQPGQTARAAERSAGISWMQLR